MNARRFGGAMLMLMVLLASCSDDGSPATNGVSTTDMRTPDAAPPTEPSVTEPSVTEAAVDLTDTTNAPATVPTDSLTYVDEADSVLAVVGARGDTTRFMQLADALGNNDVFRQERGVTVLVPVDSAWDAFGGDEFEALLGDPNGLALLLSEHLAIGVYAAGDLLAAGELSTAMARTLPVAETNSSITIGGATVLDADLTAENGVAHLIDAVIVP